MRDAFKGKPVTAAANHTQAPKSATIFIIGGIIGAIIIFIILGLLGAKRKKESVNQKLYDRQLKTSWKGV